MLKFRGLHSNIFYQELNRNMYFIIVNRIWNRRKISATALIKFGVDLIWDLVKMVIGNLESNYLYSFICGNTVKQVCVNLGEQILWKYFVQTPTILLTALCFTIM